MTQDERTIKLVGEQGIEKLHSKKISVLGIGGVGGYVVEALVRAGINHIVLIDHDVVTKSNINRQIIALHSTVGLSKVEVMKKRLLDIRPSLEIETYQDFYLPNQNKEFMFSMSDYIVDCIDTITAKIAIAKYCEDFAVPVISCMGTGNKLEANNFHIDDIYQTSICPLAKVMRRELKKQGVKKLKVLYSKATIMTTDKDDTTRKQTPGSISFVPSVAGLLIANEVVKDILEMED